MKYVVLIIDGAAGLPLQEYGGKTCLELAHTPSLDMMATEGYLGLVRTVPPGMEPGSAPACMSVLGYNPAVYYKGRAAIEARSMGLDIGKDEVVYRCNLVSVRDGRMYDYSAGHIATEEARELVKALNEKLGGEAISFHAGVNYRHILKLKGREETLQAECTPPHDIPGLPVDEYMPRGPGSDFLRDLMARSEAVFKNHSVNVKRQSRNEVPASGVWLFWGCGRVPDMPPFKQVYGLSAALTSGVDLLCGLANMAAIEVLDIAGVTDGSDNDYSAQVSGAIKALKRHDLVIIHVEAPDEAAHSGSVEGKIGAIQRVDEEMICRLRDSGNDDLRVLIMPDHPTPIELRTHTADPVPFLLWGNGFGSNGVRRFTETEAESTGVFIEEGYTIMSRLIKKQP